MGHVIIVGYRDTSMAELAAIVKAIETISKDNKIITIEEEPSMFSTRHINKTEMMEYHRHAMDLFDMEELLRDPKPLKVKVRIKKDSLYRSNLKQMGRGRR